MPRNVSEPSPAARATTMAAWLAAGQPAHALAVALMAVSLLALVFDRGSAASASAWMAALVVGLAETGCAVRVAFDRSIFAAWAHHWRHATSGPEADMADFDATLARGHDLSSRPLRPLDNRLAGARRLLYRQFGCLLAQLAAVLLALVLRGQNVA